MRTNDRLLRILKALGDQARTLSLTELADAVELPKSTTLRFLRSMEPDGWVVRNADGAYALGPALFVFADKYIASDSVLAAASPLMRELRDELGESINLSRLMGTARTCVQEFASPESLRLVLGVGSIGPLHAGASGLLLLAHMDPSERQAVYEQGLPRLTRHTLTSPKELERQCAAITDCGWAMTRSQRTVGGVAIAIPIRDPGAAASVSALGVYGPEARFIAKHDQHRWLDGLFACAREIERATAAGRREMRGQA